MLTVPLFVELLRTRPALLVAAAALAQAALWTLVPVLFYSAPPPALAEVLAFGREFQLGGDLGPPLAQWLAELAFRIGGLFGVYLLSQACVVTTYLAVFALGRRIVGDSHAAIAVLLMAGIAAFTVPTPDFGPGVLAMALWALALLLYGRAMFEQRRTSWIALGAAIGLLLFTTTTGLVLFALLLAFTLSSERGRAQLTHIEPWIGGVVAVLIFFPSLIWLDQTGGVSFESFASIDDNVRAWARMIAVLVAGHAGLAVLVALAYGVPFRRRRPVPQLERAAVDPEARRFVYVFALAPALAVLALAPFISRPDAFVAQPLVVLSGVAVVVAAGDRIRLTHHGLMRYAWIGLLALPPLLTAAVVLMPRTFGVDLAVGWPAAEMGRFFGEDFARRTGRPLSIVAGEPRTAALIAIAAPSRPSLFLDAAPERTPWVTRQDIAENGALVVWPTTDTRGAPPAAIRERFPGLANEVPRVFERRFGGGPAVRIGWGVIRPRAAGPPPVR